VWDQGSWAPRSQQEGEGCARLGAAVGGARRRGGVSPSRLLWLCSAAPRAAQSLGMCARGCILSSTLADSRAAAPDLGRNPQRWYTPSIINDSPMRALSDHTSSKRLVGVAYTLPSRRRPPSSPGSDTPAASKARRPRSPAPPRGDCCCQLAPRPAQGRCGPAARTGEHHATATEAGGNSALLPYPNRGKVPQEG
jgi:hypothetical protein